MKRVKSMIPTTSLSSESTILHTTKLKMKAIAFAKQSDLKLNPKLISFFDK
jgi:hypothetical protein